MVPKAAGGLTLPCGFLAAEHFNDGPALGSRPDLPLQSQVDRTIWGNSTPMRVQPRLSLRKHWDTVCYNHAVISGLATAPGLT
jgi:hypothetical protein